MTGSAGSIAPGWNVISSVTGCLYAHGGRWIPVWEEGLRRLYRIMRRVWKPCGALIGAAGGAAIAVTTPGIFSEGHY